MGVVSLSVRKQNVVQGFVVDAECLVGVLDQLVNGKSGVVRFDDGVGYFGWRYDAEGAVDTVWVLFTDLADEEGSHAWPGASAERVRQLEALQIHGRNVQTTILLLRRIKDDRIDIKTICKSYSNKHNILERIG